MMINRILTICAAAALGAAGTSVAHAQQGYPVPPGSVYSSSPGSYPQPGYSDRRPEEFNVFDDDDDVGNPAAALPSPRGPVLSPDDPRYGRPAGPPSVIYADRPPGGTYTDRPPGGPAYPDNGVPAANVVYPPAANSGYPPAANSRYPSAANSGYPPDDDRPRPPGAIGAAPGVMTGAPSGVTGSVQPQAPVGADGKPMTLAALPPEEQPEAAPVQLPPHLRRQEVSFATKEPAGTIVVDTSNTYLYYVLGGGRAMRYGVRVGRDGFTWTGVQKVSRKAEWPDWHPPPEMIERQPYLPRFMAGGPGNPLGARAMYLGSTVYRIHGTNQPSTIGKFVSSGCIGMLNEDVSDLFERVKVGTRVVVLPGGPPPGTATASAAPPPGGSAAALPPAVAAAQAAPLSGTQPSSVPPLPAPVTVR